MNIQPYRESVEQAGIAVLAVSAIWRVVIVEVFGMVAEFIDQKTKVSRARRERSEERTKGRVR